MGRRESPVDPAEGPVQHFAYELRKLRQEAGGPTYRRLAARCDYSVTTLSQAAAGDRLPSLSVALAYATACGGDREEWERRWREASEEETARATAPTAPEDETEEPPYRGLARFEPGDEAAFHGRTALTAELLELVRDKRFAAVFGPSGSGKSSLLRAGLIPRLRGEGDGREEGDDGGVARPAAVRILTPGPHPGRTHARALDAADGEGDTWVLVDQFEEIFTLCHDADERSRFLERLLAARDPGSRLRVVIAVRADFYGRCAEHRGLTEALRDANLLVGPMSPGELREAIVRPAAARGLIVERPLTARLVSETQGEPGGLPLMSHVLLETWRRRKGRTLTLDAYEAAGGVHGAVAQTAERVYSELSPRQATLARRILLRLIAPGEGAEDTRRPAARDELACAQGAEGEDPDTALVLERLTRARLLTLDEDTVDLAHEALITSWPRLRAWIEEDRARLRAHRRLTEAARTWEELARDPGALYRGSRLAAVEERFAGLPVDDGELSRLERDFLAASQAARVRERRRLRGGAAALCALLVLAMLAGVVAWQQTRTNDRQHIEAEARRIAAVADSMRISEPRRAMRLSVAAWRLADTPETRSALLGALSQPESDALTLPGGTQGGDSAGETERFLSADGRTVVSTDRRRAERWDVPGHRRIAALPGTGSDPTSSGGSLLSRDGRTLINSDEEMRISARDLTRREPARRLHGARGTAVGISHDGRVLALSNDTPERDVLTFWDVRRGRKILERHFPTRQNGPSAALSTDGAHAAVCADGRPLELWSLDPDAGEEAEKPRRTGSDWPEEARRDACGGNLVEFTPDGRDLLSLDGEGIHARDARTGEKGRSYKLRGLSSMAVSTDGRLIAATDTEELVVWRRDGPRRSILRYPLVSEFVGDIGIDSEHGVIRYLAGKGQIVRSLSLAGVHRDRHRGTGARYAVFSPDGRRLATARHTAEGLAFEMRDGRTGQVTDRLPPTGCHHPGGQGVGHRERAMDCMPLLAFNGGSRTLAYGASRPMDDLGVKERISLWDSQRQRRVRSLDISPHGKERLRLNDAEGMAFARDGHTLLVSRIPENELVEAWDTRSGKRLRTIRHTGGSGLAPHPLRNEVATTQGHFLNPGTGRHFRRALTQDQTSTVAYSPDGRYLAAGDESGRVTLWDGRGRRSLGLLTGTSRDLGGATPEPVSALAFSPDGATLAVAGDEGTLRLWDTASHQPLGTAMPTGRDPLTALGFSSDGATLQAAGTHTPVRLFPASPEQVAPRVCARAHGGLTPAQWKASLPDVPYRETC
ncbi:DNA-binding protein [Streptomyces sp. NPDC048172]|uniref:nSTAND1 domain-containing NTPase n=1 Tax=Streptomyces sp. NPDC048172 TaxID=3365505 RepID=UPI003716F744